MREKTCSCCTYGTELSLSGYCPSDKLLYFKRYNFCKHFSDSVQQISCCSSQRFWARQRGRRKSKK